MEDVKNSLEEIHQENQRLKRAVTELSILNDISTSINSILPMPRIIESIIKKCIKHMGVEQGAVMLLDENQGQNPFQTMVREKDSSVEGSAFHLDDQLAGWMMIHQKPLLVNEITSDERFSGANFKNLKYHSLLSVPLIQKGKLIGTLTVYNKRDGEDFLPADQRLLTIIAAQAGQLIENARLYEQEQALMRMKEEFRVAQNIQMKLLPENTPEISGYEIVARNIPAQEVGGDYFDFIALEEPHLAFCLADVSGKGLPAALLMANLQATMRSQSLMLNQVENCVQNANQLLHNSTDAEKFASLFYGVLDYRNHLLTYCNAGHDTPLLFHQNGSFQRLETGGICLGFMKEWSYQKEQVSMQEGDCLLIYSDGVTEAFNREEEEFGEQQLIDLVLAHLHLPAVKLFETIITAIQKHTGNYPQTDDITLMIIKRSISDPALA